MGKNNVNKNNATITAGFYYKNRKMDKKCRRLKISKLKPQGVGKIRFAKVEIKFP
jgi:hypothetical protein